MSSGNFPQALADDSPFLSAAIGVLGIGRENILFDGLCSVHNLRPVGSERLNGDPNFTNVLQDECRSATADRALRSCPLSLTWAGPEAPGLHDTAGSPEGLEPDANGNSTCGWGSRNFGHWPDNMLRAVRAQEVSRGRTAESSMGMMKLNAGFLSRANLTRER